MHAQTRRGFSTLVLFITSVVATFISNIVRLLSKWLALTYHKYKNNFMK